MMAENGKREMLKGVGGILVLSVLDGEPMYGYRLIAELRRRTNGYFDYPEGTLYPLLSRLEKKGFVRVVENGRVKNYQITPEGHAELDRRHKEWSSFSDACNRIYATVSRTKDSSL